MRSLLLILILPFPRQEDDLVATLKKGGWTAVDELGARPELKARLTELAAAKDPETAWWTSAALAELQAREAAAAAHVATLRVSVEAKEKPAIDLLRELLEKAELKVREDPRLGQSTVTLALKNVPFQQALDDVCRAGGFSLGRQGDSLFVHRQALRMGPCFYTGLLSAAPTHLTFQTDATPGQEPRTLLTLQAALRIDPRVRVVQARGTVVPLAVVDDTGKPLLQEAARRNASGVANVHMLGRRDGRATVSLVLDPPDKAAKKIALVRGTMEASVALRSSEIVFEKALTEEPQSQEVEGVKVVLKKGAITEKGVDVSLEITSSKAPGTWSPPETEEIVLEDVTGGPYSRGGSTRSGSSYTLHFTGRAGAAAPGKLRLTMVTQAVPRKFFFEMKDLDLP